MTKQETARVLAVLKAAWPNQQLEPETVMAYQFALDDLPYAAVEQAAARLIRSSKWFPRPAELREAALAGGQGTGWTPQRAHARYDLGRCSVCGKPAELVMDGHRRYCADHGDGALTLPAPRMALVEGGRR